MGRGSKKVKLLLGIAVIVLALWLGASSIDDFLNPLKFVSEVAAEPGNYMNRSVQVVGLIVPGSWREEGGAYYFRLTDGNATMNVVYRGEPMPTSIRPETGVTVIGVLTAPDTIRSEKILLKCPSKYQQSLEEVYPREAGRS